MFPSQEGLFKEGCQRVGQALLRRIEQETDIVNRAGSLPGIKRQRDERGERSPLSQDTPMCSGQLPPCFERSTTMLAGLLELARLPGYPGQVRLRRADVFGHVRNRRRRQTTRCR